MSKRTLSPAKKALASAAVAVAAVAGQPESVALPAVAAPAALTPMPEYVLRLHEDRSVIRLLWWARSCLKTTAVAREVVVLRLTGQVSRDAIYCTVNEANGEDFLRAVKRDLELAGHVSEVLWGTEKIDGLDVRVGYVEFPEIRGVRARVKYIACVPSAFRGLRGDLIIDELGFVKELDDLMTAAAGCATIGATLTMMTSGVTEGTVADMLVEMGVRRREGSPRAKDMPVSLHTVTIDEAIEQGVVEYLQHVTGMTLDRAQWRAHCRTFYRTEQQWLEETGCVKKKRSESMYLPPALTERLMRDSDGGVCTSGLGLVAMVAETAKRLQPTRLFAGYDIARSNHLSVLWVWGKCGPLWRTMGVLRMRDVQYHVQFAEVSRSMSADFGRSGGTALRIRRLAVDATGLGGQLAEDLERKFRTRVEGIRFTAAIKDIIMSGLRKHAEAETMTLPGGGASGGGGGQDGEEIIKDFASIRAETTAAGHVRYVAEETDLGHADHAWAAGLGIYAGESKVSTDFATKCAGGVSP